MSAVGEVGDPGGVAGSEKDDAPRGRPLGGSRASSHRSLCLRWNSRCPPGMKKENAH